MPPKFRSNIVIKYFTTPYIVELLTLLTNVAMLPCEIHIFKNHCNQKLDMLFTNNTRVDLMLI